MELIDIFIYNDNNIYHEKHCIIQNSHDFTNIYADISFGGLGSPDKFTTVITRTEKIRDIILNALKKGVIRRKKLNIACKNEMKELITQFSQSKIRRYENFLKKKLICVIKNQEN